MTTPRNPRNPQDQPPIELSGGQTKDSLARGEEAARREEAAARKANEEKEKAIEEKRKAMLADARREEEAVRKANEEKEKAIEENRKAMLRDVKEKSPGFQQWGELILKNLEAAYTGVGGKERMFELKELKTTLHDQGPQALIYKMIDHYLKHLKENVSETGAIPTKEQYEKYRDFLNSNLRDFHYQRMLGRILNDIATIRDGEKFLEDYPTFKDDPTGKHNFKLSIKLRVGERKILSALSTLFSSSKSTDAKEEYGWLTQVDFRPDREYIKSEIDKMTAPPLKPDEPKLPPASIGERKATAGAGPAGLDQKDLRYSVNEYIDLIHSALNRIPHSPIKLHFFTGDYDFDKEPLSKGDYFYRSWEYRQPKLDTIIIRLDMIKKDIPLTSDDTPQDKFNRAFYKALEESKLPTKIQERYADSLHKNINYDIVFKKKQLPDLFKFIQQFLDKNKRVLFQGEIFLEHPPKLQPFSVNEWVNNILLEMAKRASANPDYKFDDYYYQTDSGTKLHELRDAFRVGSREMRSDVNKMEYFVWLLMDLYLGGSFQQQATHILDSPPLNSDRNRNGLNSPLNLMIGLLLKDINATYPALMDSYFKATFPVDVGTGKPLEKSLRDTTKKYAGLDYAYNDTVLRLAQPNLTTPCSYFDNPEGHRNQFAALLNNVRFPTDEAGFPDGRLDFIKLESRLFPIPKPTPAPKAAAHNPQPGPAPAQPPAAERKIPGGPRSP